MLKVFDNGYRFPYNIKYALEYLSFRFWKHLCQKIFWGFSEDETWSLYNTIAAFTLPRIRHFRKHVHGYPGGITFEQWQEILDKIIFSLEEYANENENEPKEIDETRKYWERMDEGTRLFGQYFGHLWN